ncbi:MAG: transcriptional repressor [Aliidongia sp.]
MTMAAASRPRSDRAETVCTTRGVRLTELRRQVLELVWRRHEPVGAYDLLDELKVTHRRAAPPTVYRALEFLIDQGLVHRLESLNAYIGCTRPEELHAGQFLICTRCDSIGELDDPGNRRSRIAPRRRHGLHRRTADCRGARHLRELQRRAGRGQLT